MEDQQKKRKRRIIIISSILALLLVIVVILVVTGRVRLFTKGTQTDGQKSAFIDLGSLLPKRKQSTDGIIPTEDKTGTLDTSSGGSQNLGGGTPLPTIDTTTINVPGATNQIPPNTQPAQSIFGQIYNSIFGSGTASTNTNTGSTGTSGQGGKRPQCSDGIDNDGDRLIDLGDTGCASDFDDSELDSRQIPTDCDQLPPFLKKMLPRCNPGAPKNQIPPIVLSQCSDTKDNDSDTFIDLKDPGCKNKNDNDETDAYVPSQCSDTKDNDNNGLIDAQDPGCASTNDDDESGYVPDLMLTPDKTTIAVGNTLTLYWASPSNTEFKDCLAFGGYRGWAGSVLVPSSSQQVQSKSITYAQAYPSTRKIPFGVTCTTTTTNKKIVARTEVTFDKIPAPDKIVLTADPAEVATGETTNLSWTSPTNTTFSSCKGIGAGFDWANKILAPLSFPGEVQGVSFVSVPSLTTQYVINCTNGKGDTISAQTTVKITKSNAPKYDPCKDPNASKINITCPINAQASGASASNLSLAVTPLSADDQAIIDDLLRKYAKIAPNLQDLEDAKSQVEYYQNIVKTSLAQKGACEERISDDAWWDAVDPHAVGRILNPFDGGSNWERYPIPFGIIGEWNKRKNPNGIGGYEPVQGWTFHTLGKSDAENIQRRDANTANYGKSYTYPYYLDLDGFAKIDTSVNWQNRIAPYTGNLSKYYGTFITSRKNAINVFGNPSPTQAIDLKMADYFNNFDSFIGDVECWPFSKDGVKGTCVVY